MGHGHRMMKTADVKSGNRPCVGILFNAYERLDRYCLNQESEIAVEKTAHDVLQAVTLLGYSAFLLPIGSNLKKMHLWLEQFKPDVIVNLCEGYRGCPQFESHMAALLEIEEFAFTGNPAKTLMLSQDKNKTKILLKASGFRTPDFAYVESANTEINLSFPLIVKPNHEDASIGIGVDSVVNDQKGLRIKIEELLSTYGRSVLVEEYVAGREFNVAVLDNSEPIALHVSEIDFSGMPSSVFPVCSYEAKWLEDHPLYMHSVPQCPASIDSHLRDTLQRDAVRAFSVMECRDYARIDYRVSAEGIPYVLEVNPNPDISVGAGYARALNASGYDYREFWEMMIRKALRRKENNDQVHAKIRQNVAN